MEYKITCNACKRYLGTAYGTVIAEIKCSNSKCKEDNKVKITTSDSDTKSLRYKFKENS
jgi:phage FluMu protein Com